MTACFRLLLFSFLVSGNQHICSLSPPVYDRQLLCGLLLWIFTAACILFVAMPPPYGVSRSSHSSGRRLFKSRVSEDHPPPVSWTSTLHCGLCLSPPVLSSVAVSSLFFLFCIVPACDKYSICSTLSPQWLHLPDRCSPIIKRVLFSLLFPLLSLLVIAHSFLLFHVFTFPTFFCTCLPLAPPSQYCCLFLTASLYMMLFFSDFESLTLISTFGLFTASFANLSTVSFEMSHFPVFLNVL